MIPAVWREENGGGRKREQREHREWREWRSRESRAHRKKKGAERVEIRACRESRRRYQSV